MFRRPRVQILVQKPGILRMIVIFICSPTKVLGRHLNLTPNRFLPHLFPTKHSRIVLTRLHIVSLNPLTLEMDI